jgi:hypothetical protein
VGQGVSGVLRVVGNRLGVGGEPCSAVGYERGNSSRHVSLVGEANNGRQLQS